MNGPILALDPARRTGFAIGHSGRTPQMGVIRLGQKLDMPEDVWARALGWIGNVLDGKILERPGLLAIEPPIPPAQIFGVTRFETTLIALGLSAIFRGAARHRGIPIILAPINSWRKYALGRGNMKGRDAKAAMVRMCRALNWGDDVPHDAAEAAGIWLFACGQVSPERATRPEPLFSGAAA